MWCLCAFLPQNLFCVNKLLFAANLESLIFFAEMLRSFLILTFCVNLFLTVFLLSFHTESFFPTFFLSYPDLFWLAAFSCFLTCLRFLSVLTCFLVVAANPTHATANARQAHPFCTMRIAFLLRHLKLNGNHDVKSSHQTGMSFHVKARQHQEISRGVEGVVGQHTTPTTGRSCMQSWFGWGMVISGPATLCHVNSTEKTSGLMRCYWQIMGNWLPCSHIYHLSHMICRNFSQCMQLNQIHCCKHWNQWVRNNDSQLARNLNKWPRNTLLLSRQHRRQWQLPHRSRWILPTSWAKTKCWKF